MSAQPQSDPGCRVILTRTRAAFARFVRNALLLVHETVLESGLSFLMLARTAIASGQKWSANQGPARVQIGMVRPQLSKPRFSYSRFVRTRTISNYLPITFLDCLFHESEHHP